MPPQPAQLIRFQRLGMRHRTLNQRGVPGYCRERPCDIVNDAGINLVAGPRQFLPDLLVMNLTLQLRESLGVTRALARRLPPPPRAIHRRP